MHIPDLIAVCATDSYFADDVHGLCARCHGVIHFRPHTALLVPAASRVCLRCAIALGAEVGGFHDIVISDQTAVELLAYFGPTGRPS